MIVIKLTHQIGLYKLDRTMLQAPSILPEVFHLLSSGNSRENGYHELIRNPQFLGHNRR